MKSKLKALLGIALTLVLLASLTVGLAAPAAADPGTLKFSTLALPKVGATGNYWAYPGSDVGAIAIAADGDTLFAAVKEGGWKVMKSTDGGYAWKELTGFTGDGTIVDVVVSPDYEEDTTVFVATQNLVYQSVDGGKRFFKMNQGWSTSETITDLDVALDERGRLAYMVGTKDVELGTSADATAEWFADKTAPSGNYSVELTLTANPDDNAHVEIYLPSDTTLADLEGMSYKYFVDSAGSTLKNVGGIATKDGWSSSDPVYQAPYLTIQFSVDGVPGGIVQHDVAVITSIDEWLVDEIEGTEMWHGTFGGGNLTFAEFIETYGTAEVPSVWLNLDKNGANADAVVAHSYVDAIEINGVTYDLEPADVYVLSTATGMTWQPQGINTTTTNYDVLACAFSPFFADDEGISAVITDATKTRVRFSFSYVGADDPQNGWGKDIGDAKVKDAKGYEFASNDASIAFPDDFDPWGTGNNICFVGIDAKDKDGDLGDVYKVKLGGVSSATDLDIRGVITTLQPTATNIFSIDVCGDAESASILVGTAYLNRVYRSTDSGESWSKAGKSPTGGTAQVLMSPDFLDSGIAYAGTLDAEDNDSAFSRTKDSGNSWDQISLIDYGEVTDGYTVTSLTAAGYNADGTLHMVTQVSGDDGAVWKKIGKHWERIWSYANVKANISKVIVNGDDSIFAVDFDLGKIYRSSNMGATWPKTITTKTNLTAVAIVSPTTLYTGHEDGGLYCSTRSGVAWTPPKASDITADVVSISVEGDVVLVSSVDDKVFISSDGGQTVETVGGINPGALASFDLNFTDNDIIYAAGAPEDGVWRAEVDLDDPADAEWEQILDDTISCSSPAITLPPSGILYATDATAVATDSTSGLWRSVNPTAPAPYVSFEQVTKGLSTGDTIGLASFDVSPTILFCLNTAATPEAYWKQVLVYSDTLDRPVTLASPADGAAGVGDLYAGQYEVSAAVTWAKMSGATSYQYQVSIDEDFDSVVFSGFTAGQIAPLKLSPNTTYYWRVRVAEDVGITTTPKAGGAPVFTPWPAAWSFRTAIGATAARPGLEAPDAGATDVLLSPTFEWSGIAWAERYEFELATGPGTTAGGYFADVLVGLTGTNALVSTAWKCDIALDYEGRYYWHVKAIGVDTETPWSDVGTFVTMAKPVLPPEPVTPVEIPPVQEITPAWIWAIIGIGAVLVIAVVVLIVTTRRVP